MNEKSLEKNLANMERELVNLQTAHDVGLGVVQYYDYSGSSSSSVNVFGLNIKVASGERPFPFMQILMRKRNNVITETVMIWINDDSGNDFDAYCYGLGMAICDWKITSTSKLIINEAQPDEQ